MWNRLICDASQCHHCSIHSISCTENKVLSSNVYKIHVACVYMRALLRVLFSETDSRTLRWGKHWARWDFISQLKHGMATLTMHIPHARSLLVLVWSYSVCGCGKIQWNRESDEHTFSKTAWVIAYSFLTAGAAPREAMPHAPKTRPNTIWSCHTHGTKMSVWLTDPS